MNKQANTYKWERATTQKRERRPAAAVSTMQLYREISEGYDRFMARRVRTATLRQQEGRP